MPPLPGPVYIHAELCERRVGANSIPEEYRGRLLTFAAYGEDRELVKEIRLSGGNEDEAAEKLFANHGGEIYPRSEHRRGLLSVQAGSCVTTIRADPVIGKMIRELSYTEARSSYRCAMALMPP
jgi:Protein of unknown function (DUF1203)